ncbi:hypothetical protein EJ07DRAFT_180593 [Lizonia empirigonia]|nr:hypothetical protein EJ07DRAFT_180593 [Lizonia empirigonia]
MRTTTIISSSLLAIAVSAAPVDLPKLPVGLSSMGLPSLPSLSTGFSTTLPTGLPTFPTGAPSLPSKPVAELELPVENLPVKRADLRVVDGTLKEVKIATLSGASIGNVKLSVKRADLPMVDGLLVGVKIPTLHDLPTNDVKLPVKRADAPIVGNVLNDIVIIDGVDPKVHLPLPVSTGLTKKAADYAVNAPTNIAIDDALEVSDVNLPDINIEIPDVNVHQPTVNVPAVGVPAVAAPAVPAVSVPTLPTAGVPATRNLPKVGLQSRDIKQSLPVGVDVPLDAGDVQIGTADKYVEEVIQGTTIKDLPEVGMQTRQAKQSLPIVGSVDVPLDAGKIQVGTVDKYVEDVQGTTGL